MAKLISQSCGELQPAVCLSRGYATIWRRPIHSWTSDKPQKQATAKQPGQLSASIADWIVSQHIQPLFDGEKCVLLLCAWKPAFLRSGHNFVQIVQLLESNNCNATKNDSKPKRTYRWMLLTSMVRNGMVLQRLQRFVTWLVGILTDCYYKELIDIGAKSAFSIWHRAQYVRDIGKLILEGRLFTLWTLSICKNDFYTKRKLIS